MKLPQRLPTFDESNRVFTALMVGWGPVIGSALSFLFSGAIIWAVLRLIQGRIHVPKQREFRLIALAFALFFLSEALSGAITYRDAETLREIGENLPFLGFLLVLGRLMLSPRERVVRAVELGVVSGAFAAIVAAAFQILVLGQNQARVEGLAGNPGPYALAVSIVYGLSVLVAVRNEGRMRILAIAAAACAACALLLSGMRSLWPILVLAPLAPLIAFRLRPRAVLNRKVLIAGAATVLLVGVLSFDFVENRVASLASDYREITEQDDLDNSLGQRLRMWSAGLELAGERPLFGHGPGNAARLLSERAEEEGRPPIRFSHFHNFILNAMVRSGVVGVLSILFLLAAPLVLALRARRDEIGNFGLAMLLVVEGAYVLSGLFGIMLGHDITDALFTYCIIVAAFLIFAEPGTPSERPSAEGNAAHQGR